MKLRTVSVKNYRGLRDFSISLSDRTVLVGGNNTCKTTLLEAINLTLHPGFYYGPGLLSEYDFYNKRYEQPDNQIRIDLTFCNLTSEESMYFGDHVEPVDQDGKVIETASGTDIFDNAPKVLRIHFASRYEDEEILCGVYYTRQGEDEPVSKEDRRQIGFHYLNLHRPLERTFSLGANSNMQRIMRKTKIDLREQQRQILAQFPDVANVLLENQNFKELLQTIENRFRQFTYLAEPHSDAPSVKYEISDLTFSEINRSIQMFIHTPNSEGALPLTRQGSGTQNALVLALLIYLSELQDNTIVAIDEPELSLHPHAQRYLMEKLKEAGFQLILATHSPAVAESFNLTDVRLLQHRDGRLQSFSIGESAVEANPDKTLAILKRKLVDAYFSQAILLVEGDTEEGAFLGFNTSLRERSKGIDLHKQELTLFNVQGYNEIGQVLDALRPLPVRKILLVDNDENESFYGSLREKVDLLVRTPKTPAGDDFEGMIAWQSPREILDQAIEQQMKNHKLARRLPGSFKQQVYKLKENGQGNADFLQQLLNLDQTPLYFGSASTILAAWESSNPHEKNLIRWLYAETFREFKGFRAAFEWASLYPSGQLPLGIVKLFEKILNLLAGKIESGAEHVLAEGS
jgi:putative ATP-dependent endonuclease of OLD family